MTEDYQVHYHTFRAVPTGEWETLRNGKRRMKTVGVEVCNTDLGELQEDEWYRLALEEAKKCGELELLESIEQYVRTHCFWLHSEKEVKYYALDCLCGRSYWAWKEFRDEIIWM